MSTVSLTFLAVYDNKTEAHHIDMKLTFEVVNEIILRIHHGKKLLLSRNMIRKELQPTQSL
jgi:hypothetical protein